MNCSTCRVLLLKWSRSGPRSQPEPGSFMITSWNKHKQVTKTKVKSPQSVLLHGCWADDVTWCCKVFPPFCVTETVISSSSSRIFWLYSESFSRMYPVCSTMSSKWDTWKQEADESLVSSPFTAASILGSTYIHSLQCPSYHPKLLLPLQERSDQGWWSLGSGWSSWRICGSPLWRSWGWAAGPIASSQHLLGWLTRSLTGHFAREPEEIEWFILPAVDY